MFRYTELVMTLTPLGVFGAMGYNISHMAAGHVVDGVLVKGWPAVFYLLGRYARLVGSLYLSLFVMFAFVFVPILLACGVRVRDFLKAIREPALTAFSTASSEAALPRLLDEMVRFGVPRRVAGFVIPTGYSFNLDGSTLYLVFASLAIAQAAHVHLSVTQQITMVLTFMLSSKGVAGVQQPAGAVVHGDARVAAGVPRERNGEDRVGQPREVAHGGEALPRLAGARVAVPLGVVGPMARPVALALGEGRLHRRGVLVGVQVHRRRGKVREAAGVVEVEVRDQDVAHVLGVEAEAAHVLDGRGGAPRVDAGDGGEGSAEAPRRVAQIVGADAGVDEHEAARGRLDEQAVRHHVAALEEAAVAVHEAPRDRTHRGAIEVVHAHARSLAQPREAFKRSSRSCRSLGCSLYQVSYDSRVITTSTRPSRSTLA